MFHRALSTLSLICCAIVVASFAMFARDQLAGASQHQQSELASTAPGAPTAAATHRESSLRKSIDDANHTLISPFSSVVPSSNDWVKRGVPTVLALLIYGLGLGFVVRYLQGAR